MEGRRKIKMALIQLALLKDISETIKKRKLTRRHYKKTTKTIEKYLGR